MIYPAKPTGGEGFGINSFTIMAISLNQRSTQAPKFQEVLTRFGCNIKMRLGLHEAGDACSDQGLIILQLTGAKDEIKALEENLNNIEGIKLKIIEL